MFSRHHNHNTWRILLTLSIGFMNAVCLSECSLAQWNVITTKQASVEAAQGPFYQVQSEESWNENETALIICDVWDSHHCVNAVRRVQEIAPRIDALAKTMRARGATIIHAPSDCMPFYQGHAARERAKTTKIASNVPKDLDRWCDRIPSEEFAPYPIDQSDGGEDDDLLEHAQWAKTLESMGRNPKLPWKQQIATIHIDNEKDFVTDVGSEVWNILEDKSIRQVLICGVHTNMCVLGRPFGLRQLSQNGKRVFLVKDLTDTMYNPARWPFVNHFSGTDLVIDHIERYVSATVTSDTFFRADSNGPVKNHSYLRPARFSQDRCPHLAILIADDEYQTEKTIPLLVDRHLRKHLKVSYILRNQEAPHDLLGEESLDEADALLLSVRRQPLRAEDLQKVRMFLESGKPLIGIRTASHAFSLRDGKTVPWYEQWGNFDQAAFGGSYQNHYANELLTSIRKPDEVLPLFHSKGSLYRFQEMQPGTQVHWVGSVTGGQEQPVAWTFVRKDSGKSFYTSLGHPSDFDEPFFVQLLTNACFQACGLPLVAQKDIVTQKNQFDAGKGKQR